METINHVVNNGVMTLTLQRLDKLNALTLAMYSTLTECIAGAEKDEQIKVVVIQGSEECFSAGNDLNDFMSSKELDTDHPTVKFLMTVADMTKPLIVAAGGAAVGIGTTIMLHADFVVATDETKLKLPFAQLGLCPEFSSSYLLPMYLGYQKAAELLMFGETFGAEEAHRMGLVNRVVGKDELHQVAAERAAMLAKMPTKALMETKRLLKKGIKQGVHVAMHNELQAFGALLKSDDCQNIVAHFLNK